MPAAAPRALVVGGSIAGLSAANLLARAGWDVTVAERTAGPLAGRGAGIVTHPPLVRVLERAGVPAGTPLGVAVPGRRSLDRDGGVEAERPLPQVLTSWSRLHALLEGAYGGAVRRGAAAVALTQDGDGATVRFEDGSEHRADLVVAADGIRSTCRAVLAPEVASRYAGYVAWRGLVDEADLSPDTREAICHHFSFFVPDGDLDGGQGRGEQILGYPVAGADGSLVPGRRRYNFVWYRQVADADLAAMNTSDAGRAYPAGIPPALVRPALLEGMRQDAVRLLAPPFAEAVIRTPLPFFQPIFDLEIPQMAWSRVAVLGDAAFVARPHLGMGVTKAMEDAAALMDALAAQPSVPEALARWSGIRTVAGGSLVAHARRLGAAILSFGRLGAREQAVDAMLRETAVAPAAAG